MGSGTARSIALDGLSVVHASFPARCLLDRHSHDHAVLGVMLSGGFELKMSGRVTACVPATLFTEPAGESHSNRIAPTGASLVVVQPCPERELPRACARLFDSAVHVRDARVSALAGRITEELDVADDLTPLGVEGLALELITLASRRSSADSPRPPAWLRRVESLIHDRFLHGVRIAELAREADLHPAHVARAFRTHYHTSIATYIRNLRVHWAADRVARSSESLAMIAHRAGFADQSHFTRAFRVHMGVTPGEYRRERRHGG